MGLFDSLGEDLRRLECRPVVVPWPVTIKGEKWQIELRLPPLSDSRWSDALIAAKVPRRTVVQSMVHHNPSRLLGAAVQAVRQGDVDAITPEESASCVTAFLAEEGIGLEASDNRVVLAREDCRALCANGAGPPPAASIPVSARLLPLRATKHEPRELTRDDLSQLFTWSERSVKLPRSRHMELAPVALLRWMLAEADDDVAYHEAIELEKKAPAPSVDGAGSPPADSTATSATPSEKPSSSASAVPAKRRGKRATVARARKPAGTAPKAPSS